MKHAAAAVKEGGGYTVTSALVLVLIFRLHMLGLNIFRTRLITYAEDGSKICPIFEASATATATAILTEALRLVVVVLQVLWLVIVMLQNKGL